MIQNMMDAQHDNGVVPDISPEYVQFVGPFVDTPEWGSTSIFDLWFLYRFYGDTLSIRKAFPMMIRYAKHLESRAENNLFFYGLNAWLDVGPNHKSPATLNPLGITASCYSFMAV